MGWERFRLIAFISVIVGSAPGYLLSLVFPQVAEVNAPVPAWIAPSALVFVWLAYRERRGDSLLDAIEARAKRKINFWLLGIAALLLLGVVLPSHKSVFGDDYRLSVSGLLFWLSLVVLLVYLAFKPRRR